MLRLQQCHCTLCPQQPRYCIPRASYQYLRNAAGSHDVQSTKDRAPFGSDPVFCIVDSCNNGISPKTNYSKSINEVDYIKRANRCNQTQYNNDGTKTACLCVLCSPHLCPFNSTFACPNGSFFCPFTQFTLNAPHTHIFRDPQREFHPKKQMTST